MNIRKENKWSIVKVHRLHATALSILNLVVWDCLFCLFGPSWAAKGKLSALQCGSIFFSFNHLSFLLYYSSCVIRCVGIQNSHTVPGNHFLQNAQVPFFISSYIVILSFICSCIKYVALLVFKFSSSWYFLSILLYPTVMNNLNFCYF